MVKQCYAAQGGYLRDLSSYGSCSCGFSKLDVAGRASRVIAAFIVAVCLATAAPADAADTPTWSSKAGDPAAGATTHAKIKAKAEEPPGDADPINTPKKLTLFPVSTIGLLASQNSAFYTDLFDYAATDVQLKQWAATAHALASGDSCEQSQRRRLGHGRVSMPEFEQAVCMTNFGVTVYTSPLKINDGSRASLAFAHPSTSTVGRNFDLAVGEMTRRPAQDKRPHQEIVAAYANLDNRLQIDVITWDAAASPDPSKGELRIAASYIGPPDEAPTGDVAVTLGDYMNDGSLQIISAADASAAGGPGSVRLAAYRYTSDGTKQALERIGTSYTFDVASGRPTSLALASADFTGRGHEQFIMSYLAPQDANANQMAFAFFDPAKLEQIGPPRAKEAIGPIAKDSYADIAAGLFRFDPKAVLPPPSDPFFHRELAIAYASPDAKIFAGVLQVRDGEPPTFHPGPIAQLSSDKWPIATAGVGPTIAAGNFVGLKNDGVDPRDQIAVALPERGDQFGRTVPDLVVARVDGTSFAIDPVWRERMRTYDSSGLAFGVPILAYDRGGESFYLGNPAHITIPHLIDPQYVVNMPPRHVDALPTKPGDDPPYEIVNLLAGVGPSAFSVTLRDSVDQTLTETSTNSSSAQFGGGLTQVVGGTVGGGFMNVATFETSASVKTAVSFETIA